MFSKQLFGLRTTTKGHDRIVCMRNSFLLLTLLAGALAALYFSRQAAAANITWNGLGGDNKWSTGANWAGGVAPAGSGDLAIFDGTSSKNATIDIDVNIGSLEIDSGYTGTITQAAGKNITLSTQTACAGAAGFCQNGGTFTLTSGSMFVQGNYNQSGGTFTVGSDLFTEVNNFEQDGGNFNGGSGTINMQSRLELKGTAQFTSTTGTLTINGDFKDDVAGTAFTHNNGTVTFTGPFFGGSLPINLKASGETFNNLNFNLDDGKTCNLSGGPLTVQTSLQLNDGLINNGTLQVPAPAPVTVSPNFDGTTFQGVLLLTGAAARTVTFSAGANLLNVDLNASATTINTSGSGTLTFPSLTLEAGIINQGGTDFLINGNYNQSGGTFNVGSDLFTEVNNFEQTGGNFNGGSGTLDMQSRLELKGTAQFTSTTGTLTINGDFKDDVAGTAFFTNNNGTVTFTGPFFGNSLPISLKAGGETFNNLNFNLDDGKTCNLSGGALTVQGSLQLNDGFVNNSVLSPQGNLLVAATFDGGTTAVTFAGTTNQTFTNNGGANLTGTWTVNKSNGRVTLLSDLTLQSGQPLDITSGTLDQGGSFNLTAGPITIGSAGGSVGRLTNQGTGDLILGGTLTVNNGSTITLNGGGGGCTDADSILIRSSVNGTQRTWSGTGKFFLTDVDVKDQLAGTPPSNVNVFSGSDSGNNSNFSFLSGCNPTAAASTVNGRIVGNDGNPVEGAVVRLSGTQNRKTITDANGNYNFFEVETNGFYTVTPSRVNYNFAPATRGFSALGARTEASFTATANGNRQNPLDTTEYFVRQQYVDFLGREPEEQGFNAWTDTINNCAPGDTSCDRVHVSEMFFRSEEFQQRGYFIYRFYSTAFGQKPDYAAFAPDLQRVSGFLTDDQLEAAKTAFANDFVNRRAFAPYTPMTDAQYVDALSQAAGMTLSSRQALLDSLEAGTMTRAQALRQIAESGEVYKRYYNQAFVVMEYFGYLRRDPDILYLSWIDVLNANPADSRHMVEGFVDATEYRNRFKQ